MKTIDYLFHFTTSLSSIQKIIAEGFKPSYSKEQFSGFDILVPMISFSNVLLRDVGKAEVLHYGDYGMVMRRDWGLKNELNPVCYTYRDATLDQSVFTILNNTAFLHFLKDFKPTLALNTQSKGKPISEQMNITNLSTEVAGILDYLSVNFDEKLFDNIVQHAASTYTANQGVIKLAKPYEVQNKGCQSFVAYNDREWRKTYPALNYIYKEEKDDYEFWYQEPKPHFHDAPYIIAFDLDDLKAVLVADEKEKAELENWLQSKFGAKQYDAHVANQSLTIGTYDQLMGAGL
ncbi:MAG: abortive infection system antitoxin AbiGi family protein [Chitinophagaceae bacterium]